ncbi:DUF7224 domain-containing protein [Natronoglycomyces albus]|uniref:DUF7224 domain-containing protein n=1 Tax=Natronoglycomyces albus TaxID=2811108 RepID=A0A895XET7_9ACTN|nr:hypothetical protein [Natronoglycomyces albus]QSB04351.1 hypothetical protein JQS30_11150 [Natronoglycomyces albus]
MIASGFVIAAPMAKGIDWDTTLARPDSDLECHQYSFEICAWPESESFLPQVDVAASGIAGHLRDYGLDVPATLVEDAVSDGDRWGFRTSPSFTDADYAASLLGGLVANPGDCTFFGPVTNPGEIYEFEVALLMGACLDIATGAPVEVADPDGQLREVLALPALNQGLWFDALSTSLATCDVDLAQRAVRLATLAGDDE